MFQAERTDSLTVGISHRRKTELLESVLQPFVLWRAPCAGALHSALQFQVSLAFHIALLLHIYSGSKCSSERSQASLMFTSSLSNLVYVLVCTCVFKVLEKHVPSVWSVHAPTSVYTQDRPDSEREKPQDREHTASSGECELICANSLYTTDVLHFRYWI